MKHSSPISVFYPHDVSDSLIAQCDVKVFGNSLGVFIKMPQNAGNVVEQHSTLKTVQIVDRHVMMRLAAQWRSVPNAKLTVDLIMADKRTFRYAVSELRVDDSTIWLHVNEQVSMEN